MAVDPVDAYVELGVARSASTKEIRRAYRLLARDLHPDANAGDVATVERFHRLVRAYEQVGDPAGRLAYDRGRPSVGAAGPRAARSAPGPTGNTAERGVAAHPDLRPSHEPAVEVADAGGFRRLAWFLALAAAATLALVLTFVVSALVTADDARSPVPAARPGIAGLCKTADGWVACADTHVTP